MAVGANAIWLVGLFGRLDASLLYLLPVACIASLLPDIDAAGGGAKIHHAGGGVLGVFAGVFHGKYFHHRGLMHSVLVSVLLFLVLWIFTNILVASVAALAYFSHPLIDGFNTGVGYWYPFTQKKQALVPYALRTPLNGVMDKALLMIGCFGIVLFCLVFASALVSANTSAQSVFYADQFLNSSQL
jgi:membrane-bound metal-dependent hydrolase YbcI (DUF457 family)